MFGSNIDHSLHCVVMSKHPCIDMGIPEAIIIQHAQDIDHRVPRIGDEVLFAPGDAAVSGVNRRPAPCICSP